MIKLPALPGRLQPFGCREQEFGDGKPCGRPATGGLVFPWGAAEFCKPHLEKNAALFPNARVERLVDLAAPVWMEGPKGRKQHLVVQWDPQMMPPTIGQALCGLLITPGWTVAELVHSRCKGCHDEDIALGMARQKEGQRP